MNATDHRAEATRLLSAIDTRDWSDPSPYIDRRTEAAKTHALLAIHDLLDARLPATTPQDPMDAPVAGAEGESGSVGGGDESGAEKRHFAPYGSTNALCDETVPLGVGWDVKTGEYASDRFTVERARTTCPGCAYWLRVRQPKPTTPLPVAQDDEVIVKRADLENALYRDNAPRAEWTRTITNLRAALDRGQGA